MKVFYTQQNVGRAKYVVNYHDGVKKYDDGSAFYDIRIFTNKKKLSAFLRELSHSGYVVTV